MVMISADKVMKVSKNAIIIKQIFKFFVLLLLLILFKLIFL